MKKIIFVTVLIFCLLTSTEVAYSWFEEENNLVLNGENPLYTITQTVSNSYESLIPEDAILKDDDTYSITYQYEVIVEDGVSLETEITEVFFDENKSNFASLDGIFNFEFSLDHVETVNISNGWFSDTTIGEKVVISLTITMNNNEDIEQFSEVCYGNVNFTFVLRVSKP